MPVYLDHNATSPATKQHIQEITEEYILNAGNPSSPHSIGRNASVAVTKARHSVATALGCDVSEVIFVSGGSEANNMATVGVINQTELPLEKMHCITSSIEHPSIKEPLNYLSKKGLNLTTLKCSESGHISIEDIVKSIRPETKLVTFMVANNEIGSIQPVKQFADWLNAKRWNKSYEKQLEDNTEWQKLEDLLSNKVTVENLQSLHFHVDAVQALGKIQNEKWQSPGIDSFTVTGHKLGGIPGIGALYLSRGRKFIPTVIGGPQERNRRAGTENLLGIISMGKVCEKVSQSNWWEQIRNTRQLNQKLHDEVSKLPGLTLNSSSQEDTSLPNTLNFSIQNEKIQGEDVLMELDMAGICVSSGSACSSGANLPSGVILALGRSEKEALNSIRISLGTANTESELEELLSTLKSIFI